MPILQNIHSPKDIKKLTLPQMERLAQEVREMIIEVISRNGGHLASSLGVVELTIALYYVFDFPEDKLVWDVSHQAYAHKILSDRKERFDTIRQIGGLSGFTRRSESVYDAFSCGHSSTSVSAALGIACGHTIKHEPQSKTIAVLGDGSMTGGMALEALNQVGFMHMNRQMLVILNNNDMSISKNVGSISSFLSRKLSMQKVFRLRVNFGKMLKSVPAIGEDLYRMAKRLENTLKTAVTPGMLFEALHLEYFGPIDGHNIGQLIKILENIKEIDEPALLHITTKKGKGYKPAEENPVYFHGCPSFDVDTGDFVCHPTPEIPTYTKVFGNTLVELARTNANIVAITAAMPEGTGLNVFEKEFPERFFDVGIAEQHGVTFAAGLATTGLKPVVAIYSTFMQRAYDQVLHDVCLDKYPVVFALDRAGFVGEDGETHQGLFDISFMRHLPNMVIMAPKDENELRHMLYTAINYNDGPVTIRYPRGLGFDVPLDTDLHEIAIGSSEVLRDGNDVLLLAVGNSVYEAQQAAITLKEKYNISAGVVNARFIKPLDKPLLNKLARKYPKFITIEENMAAGGFGSAVLEALQECPSHPLVKILGVGDTFVEHAPQAYLRQKYGLDAVGIVNAALNFVKS